MAEFTQRGIMAVVISADLLSFAESSNFKNKHIKVIRFSTCKTTCTVLVTRSHFLLFKISIAFYTIEEKMRALRSQPPGKAAVIEITKPTLRPDYVLVKTVAVALNPADWKYIDNATLITGTGNDYSGIIEEVGPKVTKSWKKGDRIAGVLHGGNVNQPEDGAFAEYLIAKGDIQLRIPDYLSFDDAATLGVGVTTVIQGLYFSLNLPSPDNPTRNKFPIFIYGGSTATGAIAIQFAKL
jgi:NADPH:quinone reductase-like Zn-dependent oxidoreductase